jgi:hypothetical protein
MLYVKLTAGYWVEAVLLRRMCVVDPRVGVTGKVVVLPREAVGVVER